MHCMAVRKRKPRASQTLGQIVGKRMLDARLETGMTQTEAAQKLAAVLTWMKPHSSTISRIETGRSPKPDFLVCTALATIYGRRLVELAPELVSNVRQVRDMLGVVVLPDEPVPTSSCNADVWGGRPKLFDDEAFFAPTTYDHYSKAS